MTVSCAIIMMLCSVILFAFGFVQRTRKRKLYHNISSHSNIQKRNENNYIIYSNISTNSNTNIKSNTNMNMNIASPTSPRPTLSLIQSGDNIYYQNISTEIPFTEITKINEQII